MRMHEEVKKLQEVHDSCESFEEGSFCSTLDAGSKTGGGG